MKIQDLNLLLHLIVGISIVIVITSCKSRKNVNYQYKARSVKDFGAKGDGISDDTWAIQKALDQTEELFFPDGIYNLKTKSEVFAFLTIEDKRYPKKIVFSENAWLRIDSNASSDYYKPSVFCISGRNNVIKGIIIDGLKIDGNRFNHKMTNSGMLIYSDKFLVSNILIKNSIMKDMGGGGYHIEADDVVMNKIKTFNCGNHGIGINGSYLEKDLVYDITISDYTSLNDEAYGIDFSGPYDSERPQETLLNYHFKGKVRNVKIINSKYGIKTAGNWDLDIDSVLVDGSEHNGFYISKNAPNKTIFARNLSIKNCKGNGLYLSGASHFIGKNISVENCKVLFQIDNTDIDINGLVLDGFHNNIASLRMGASNVKIQNFVIKNNQVNDEYPVWLQGKSIFLQDGRFENMNGISPIIFKDFESATLENITENTLGSRNSNFKLGATIDSKKGKILIRNSRFLNSKSIRNIHNLPIEIDF